VHVTGRNLRDSRRRRSSLRGPAGVRSGDGWWSWEDGLYRITDRLTNGEVDIETATNLSAFYFQGALVHLVNPCEECDREAL
jgi:hypothetical protein